MTSELDGAWDFEVVEEEWNDFALEDRTLVRIRPVLAFLLDGPEEDDRGFQVTTQVMSLSPPSLRGEPDPAPVSEQDLRENIEQRNIKFDWVNEGHSRYQSAHGEIAFHIVPRRFHRTSSFDHSGQPRYIAEHSVEVRHSADS